MFINLSSVYFFYVLLNDFNYIIIIFLFIRIKQNFLFSESYVQLLKNFDTTYLCLATGNAEYTSCLPIEDEEEKKKEEKPY